MGSTQPAYLFKAAINVEPCSARREEVLASGGSWSLIDVHCRGCNTVLGWQHLSANSHHVSAKIQEHKYKEGATLLQQRLLARCPGVAQLHQQATQRPHVPSGGHAMDTTPINAAVHGGEYGVSIDDHPHYTTRQHLRGRRGHHNDGHHTDENAVDAAHVSTGSLLHSLHSQLRQAIQEAAVLPVAAHC